MWHQKRQTEASRARSQERSQRPETQEAQLRSQKPKKNPPRPQKHPRRGRKKNLRVHKGIPGEGLRKKGYFSIRPPSWAPPPSQVLAPPPSFFCFLGLCSCCLGPVVGAVLLLLPLPCPLPCPMPCPCPVLQKKTCSPSPFLAETLQKGGGWGGFREGFL